jgi:hypothetical protein
LSDHLSIVPQDVPICSTRSGNQDTIRRVELEQYLIICVSSRLSNGVKASCQAEVVSRRTRIRMKAWRFNWMSGGVLSRNKGSSAIKRSCRIPFLGLNRTLRTTILVRCALLFEGSASIYRSTYRVHLHLTDSCQEHSHLDKQDCELTDALEQSPLIHLRAAHLD